MKKTVFILMCMVLAMFCHNSMAQELIIGEHLYDQVLETPHPYPGSRSGEPEIVWTDYYKYPGAAYLVFEFAKFDLAPGDWVEVRHPYGEQVHVYTGRGFLDRGGDFITKMVLGSEAIIELYSTNTDHDYYGYRIERVSRGFSEEELRRMHGDTRAICGTDDKLDAKCFETSHPEVYELSRAVARLVMDGVGTCTAWLVSCENHVMTNSHCSREGDLDSQAKLDRIEFQFMYERPECGSGDATVEYSFMGGTFLENDFHVDYALVQAPEGEDPASVYGWITLDDRLVDVGELMFIAGHPGARPKEISLYSNHENDPTGECEVYTVEADPCRSGATAPEVGYFCDTEGGSSGSPVLSRDTMKAIALHHCAYCPNRGIRIQDVIDLIMDGPNPLPPCSFFNEIGTVTLDRGKYGCDDVIEITVKDGSLPGAETQEVEIWSDTQSTPEIVWLTEDPPDSGTFIGTIPTSTDPPDPGNGVLSITEGDSITVLYIDEDDGQGGSNIPRYDYAEVDCTPPVISNVTVTWVSALEAEISWNTNEPAAGTVVYGLTIPPTNQTTDASLETEHAILLEDLDSCAWHFFKVISTDEAGNTAEDNNNGTYYMFLTDEIHILLDENMDTDPGWTYENLWEWGEATGQGGNPPSGYTGTHIVGYNLSGNYQNNLPPTYMTTTSFDCSDANETYLTFWRWLCVESSTWDHASIEISNNSGSSWHTVWQHTGGTIQESSWSFQEYDISSWAAGNSDVRLRWVMGPSDSIIAYCGWNIDDVMVSYTTDCVQPTPTPSEPTPTPTPDCLNHGDVNFDGVLSAQDAQLAFMISIGQHIPTYEEECAADCNGDGVVSAADAQQIFLAALGAASCVDPI